MLQSMAASDVAVMLKEDQKLGLPQFCSTRKGLDFQRHFTTQLAGPLTGVWTPQIASRGLGRALLPQRQMPCLVLIRASSLPLSFCSFGVRALTGNATPPGVASQLAKAAVAASYSDSAAAAAAAAASRNTFAAWAERVAQDPQAAAQRVSI
jgi:hypothetical protein